MKITIESTTRMTEFNGVPCRIWEGKTERGVTVIAFIPRVAVKAADDASQFEEELTEQKAPSPEAQSFPLRMIL